ncbi:SLC41A family transporter [Sporobolomyces salmoneus]|uniref:SLC41A family transporter n=1 Tax=Sporobolomyces salmoneus TaxID=183962 RepID=UPI003171E497
MPTQHHQLPQSDDSHELHTLHTNSRRDKGKQRRTERDEKGEEEDEVEGLFRLNDRVEDERAEEEEEEEQGLLENRDPDERIGEAREGKETMLDDSRNARLRSNSTSSRVSQRSTTTTSTGMSTQQKKLFVKETVRETLPVFFLVLIGSVLTGSLLDKLQAWRVFIRIEELFILVPILLNLKGNLEMNLAARFSTSANIGELDLRRTRRSLILGNLALLQVQALIVSLLSGLLAFLLGLASRKGVHHSLQHPIHKGLIGTDSEGNDIRGGYFEALLVLCVSMLAAGISSGVLGSFMCGLVVLCRRFRINPDNVSTPIAAVLGDVVTLVILGGLASLFAKFMGTIISTLVFLCLLGAVVLNLIFTFRNAYVQELLSVGWGPLFLAMAISSGTGVVLETYVNLYPGFSLLAPIFTALSAAPASVFVARTTTILHSQSTRKNRGHSRESFWFTGGVLFVLGVGVMELAWLYGVVTDQTPKGWGFAVCYLIAACVQTLLGLVIARQGSMLLWKFDYDPDVYALPLLSSFLDVSGQLLLVAAFELSTKVVKTAAGTTVEGVDADVVSEGAEMLRRMLIRG